MAKMLLNCENDPGEEKASLENAKIHRCDIKLKNLPKSLSYSHLLTEPPKKVKPLVKRFDIKIKKLGKGEAVIDATKLHTDETLATKSDKIEENSPVENEDNALVQNESNSRVQNENSVLVENKDNSHSIEKEQNSHVQTTSKVSVEPETKLCNGQEAKVSLDEVPVGVNGNDLEECNGAESSQPETNGQSRLSGRESRQSVSRESRKSMGRESRQSSIAGRTSRLSATSSMSGVSGPSSEESSGVEVIGYGRKTENGYEFEEEDDEEEEEEDSSDSEEDSLEDGEIRMPSSERFGRFDLNKEENEEDDNSIANHKRKLMEIFLEDSDSETKSNNKKDVENEDVVCLTDDSDHVSKIVPIGPPAKKKKNEAWVFNKKSKSADITLDDSASGVSSSFSNYFDMNSRRSSVDDSSTEESWKIDPETGDWKLENSLNNYRLKEFYINIKEEHLYNTRAKDCYLKFRNIRKTLAMQDRAFNDPIIVANKPGDDGGYGGLPCPFNCGAEFHLKDQVYFYEHVNGKCPITKLQQVVAPEKTTQCGVCRSQIPKSQLEDHFDNFHRPHPCSICQCKWQTEVELQEHILEDHASHFMAEIPPIVRKQLVTVWQTEHHKPGDLIPASQVYSRGAGGELTPVQCQQGQVFQRGNNGDVIPMQLKPPGQIVGGGVSGAFTPVQQQPGQVFTPVQQPGQVMLQQGQVIQQHGQVIQQQPGQVIQVQRSPAGHVFQRGPGGVLMPVARPVHKQIFQRMPNGELRPVMQLAQVPQQGQVFQRAPGGEQVPVSLPSQPISMQFLPTQMGNLVNRPVFRRAPNGNMIAVNFQPGVNPTMRLPIAPLQPGNLLRPSISTSGGVWTPPVAQNSGIPAATSDHAYNQAPGDQSYRIPVSQLPENIRQQLALSGNDKQNVVVVRSLPAEFSSMPSGWGQQPPSGLQGPNTELSDPPQMQIRPGTSKVVSLASRSSPTELTNLGTSSHFAPIHPANMSGGRVSVLKRLSPVVPTDNLTPSSAPEPSILQSQLTRTYGREPSTSQVKIPPQYARSANETVKIPPQYARPIAQNPQPTAPPTYSQASAMKFAGPGGLPQLRMANLSNLLTNPHVDRDGAPLSQFDKDGAPRFGQMNVRFNNISQPNIMSQPVNTPQLHSSEDGMGVETNLEDTLSDPGVDPLEDPLSVGGAGDLEDEDESALDIMAFCDTVMMDHESDKRVFF